MLICQLFASGGCTCCTDDFWSLSPPLVRPLCIGLLCGCGWEWAGTQRPRRRRLSSSPGFHVLPAAGRRPGERLVEPISGRELRCESAALSPHQPAFRATMTTKSGQAGATGERRKYNHTPAALRQKNRNVAPPDSGLLCR